MKVMYSNLEKTKKYINYYPFYRIDKNVSWNNVVFFIVNLLTRLKICKVRFWMPPKKEVDV